MPVEISLVSDNILSIKEEDFDDSNLQFVSPGDVITRYQINYIGISECKISK